MRVLQRIVSVAAIIGSAGLANAEEPPRPNVLFILTDDQGWATLGCYGSERVPTPHLDSLARDGMRFADTYVMPQCTPTRATLLTGQHTARNGMWHVIPWYGYPWAPVREPAYVENLPRDAFTLAKGMRSAEYATACIGKWHLTRNEDGDYNALNLEAGDYYGFDFVAPPVPRELFAEGGDRGVAFLTDQALGFIERHRDQPFFCYLAHHTIHGKVVAPEALVRKYRDQGAPAEGLHNATYLAALEHLDASVGRLLGKLDEWKLRERTLVVFLSDNGGVDQVYAHAPFSNGPGTDTQLLIDREEFDNAPLRAGKGSPYEGGIRVPMLVRWPEVVQPGSVCGTPVHVVDVMPTLFELAGATPPEEYVVDGVSLVPLLLGKGELPERPLYFYMPLYDVRWGATPCAVIREGDYKLIEYFGDWFDPEGKYVSGRRVELYNLRTDIGERRNLVAEMPDETHRLVAKLHAWIKACGEEVPGPNPQHDASRPLQETREKPPHFR